MSTNAKQFTKSYHNMKNIPSFAYLNPKFCLSTGDILAQNCLSCSDALPTHSRLPHGFLNLSNRYGLSNKFN